MKVKIKAMGIKSQGIEFDITTPDGKKHLGDVVLTNTGLTWCEGRTTPPKGVKVSWAKFIKWAEAQ